MNFKQWLSEANKLCTKVVGVSINDLADHRWRDCFEDELSPGQALYAALDEEGYIRRYPEMFARFQESEEIA